VPSALPAELGEETVIRVMAPLAYWLHEERPGGTAPYEEWQARLATILEREGHGGEADEIAKRFLHHARQEAGLLAERGLGQYGFFHLTFEEYLAARELARQRAEERGKRLRAHWEDPRWHEVILLTAGQLGIVEARQYDAGDLLEELLKMEPRDPQNAGRQAVLAGRALADIGLRSVVRQTQRWVQQALQGAMQDLDPDGGHPCDPPRLALRTRYEAGEALDELGWLPEDLEAWVLCPGCAADGGDLLVAKYPLTNAQFERFAKDGGYQNAAWWSAAGWRWRVEDHPEYRGSGSVAEPEYWHHPRFGREWRGYPVVGVSWYEAEAYANWLTERARAGGFGLQVWEGGQPVTWDASREAFAVRLPSDAEWTAIAGGLGKEERYPWDPPGGPATRDEGIILARANTYEARLGGTSPVAAYPLGASQPYGLIDLAGNVWEWTGSWHDEDQRYRVVRGGSWDHTRDLARCWVRNRNIPGSSSHGLGFRCVSPISRPGC
jgi:formylglycine-generating enzyme required for sulfatase activity